MGSGYQKVTNWNHGIMISGNYKLEPWDQDIRKLQIETIGSGNHKITSLRVNHDPSVGNDNMIFMRRTIGYENVQVNAIRIIADTKNQEDLKSPKVESESKKDGHRPSQNLQERQ